MKLPFLVVNPSAPRPHWNAAYFASRHTIELYKPFFHHTPEMRRFIIYHELAHAVRTTPKRLRQYVLSATRRRLEEAIADHVAFMFTGHEDGFLRMALPRCRSRQHYVQQGALKTLSKIYELGWDTNLYIKAMEAVCDPSSRATT